MTCRWTCNSLEVEIVVLVLLFKVLIICSVVVFNGCTINFDMGNF